MAKCPICNRWQRYDIMCVDCNDDARQWPNGSNISPTTSEDKVAHSSGATSSHFSPFSFDNPFESVKLTCQRFVVGNRKHEQNNPVYAEANWLKAVKSRDVGFFRDRAGHALEHLISEMRGEDDNDPGGNLGAVGWFLEAMAYVKKNDPFLYGAIQGKWNINDAAKECETRPGGCENVKREE